MVEGLLRLKAFGINRRMTMYLKRLESVGFKSFAERISIDFVPGVTAVVGPNGSGKSNITDAIRWVLGEQSAKSLRGSKMEDIIFQGSDTRKALNVAEVTLILDNSDKAVPLDYDEVSVTRRVYRSGDSEFYINKQSCRLKDIIDLFMDSGLGREAFSIISQGKVEEVLSSKAEERRTIFEEAAGVLKYKQRKKKSEYKLAETQENLNRVEDIIHEIETQITPLEKQMKTAKRYLELKEELKQEEISLLIAEIEELHGNWENVQLEIKAEDEQALRLQTEIYSKETWLEEQKQMNYKTDELIEELQDKLLQSTKQLENIEGRKQLFTERTKHFTENKQKLEEQKLETTRQLDALRLQFKEDETTLVELKQAKETSQKKINELTNRLEFTSEKILEQIEDLKSEYIEFLNEQAATRNEMQSIEKQLQQIIGKNEMQLGKFNDAISLRENLEKDKLAHEEKLQVQTNQYEEKSSLISTLKERLENDRKQFQDMQTKLYQGFQYIEKMKSRRELLEEMKEDYQGFFHGVKAVLKGREEGQLENIHGAVIELIDVPKEYISAIEMVLGGQAQHIVVQNELAARSAISWLKKTNKGRATFLPLEVIQERYVPEQLLTNIKNHEGFIGVASQLVKVNEAYRRAVNHLMGHVLIAESLKDANDIAKLTGRRYRIVTLDGDVVNPGGAMSGGAAKKSNQSLFTRDKELEEIQSKLVNYEERTIAFEKRVNDQKDKVQEISATIKTEEDGLLELQKVVQELQSLQYEKEMEFKSINDSLSNFDQEEKIYREEKNYFKTRKTELEKKLVEIKDNLENIQAKIDKLNQEAETFKHNQENIQDELQETKLLNTTQQERYRNQLSKVDQQNEQLQQITTQLNDYNKELEELLHFSNTEITMDEIDEQIDKEKELKEELTQRIQVNRQSRLERTTKIEDEERELKDINKRHHEKTSIIQQKEVLMNRLDVDLENRLNHLQTEYTVTFDRARQEYEKTEDIKASKAEVKHKKDQINRLGTVNLGAIEEYDRISERYAFLTEQQTDLISAKDTLFKVIFELDVEMKERFETTFSAIKEEFTTVFKELFGGGRAELKLTDPKDILETGVEIVAQPPGKKLQHLGLLSGGERALTAIALLFSILRVRPVPFCILDEVEAALDEANVARFAKYLKKYRDETQFIVITHRKGTMEEADVLYGVTMQESGVSRLVSVKLEESVKLIES